MKERTVCWDKVINLVLVRNMNAEEVAIALDAFADEYPTHTLSSVETNSESLVLVFRENPYDL